jgi:hypothetical protein
MVLSWIESADSPMVDALGGSAVLAAVLGRAIASAGSGVVAPVSGLATLALLVVFDRRRHRPAAS